MQPAEENIYRDITPDQYENFKTWARTKGMNISGNEDNVDFDGIPVRVEYNPDTCVLKLTPSEPHWTIPGVTAAHLHRLVVSAVDGPKPPREYENPQILRQKGFNRDTTSGAPEDAYPSLAEVEEANRENDAIDQNEATGETIPPAGETEFTEEETIPESNETEATVIK